MVEIGCNFSYINLFYLTSYAKVIAVLLRHKVFCKKNQNLSLLFFLITRSRNITTYQFLFFSKKIIIFLFFTRLKRRPTWGGWNFFQKMFTHSARTRILVAHGIHAPRVSPKIWFFFLNIFPSNLLVAHHLYRTLRVKNIPAAHGVMVRYG
jgi:hypothetical protein